MRSRYAARRSRSRQRPTSARAPWLGATSRISCVALLQVVFDVTSKIDARAAGDRSAQHDAESSRLTDLPRRRFNLSHDLLVQLIAIVLETLDLLRRFRVGGSDGAVEGGVAPRKLVARLVEALDFALSVGLIAAEKVLVDRLDACAQVGCQFGDVETGKLLIHLRRQRLHLLLHGLALNAGTLLELGVGVTMDLRGVGLHAGLNFAAQLLLIRLQRLLVAVAHLGYLIGVRLVQGFELSFQLLAIGIVERQVLQLRTNLQALRSRLLRQLLRQLLFGGVQIVRLVAVLAIGLFGETFGLSIQLRAILRDDLCAIRIERLLRALSDRFRLRLKVGSDALHDVAPGVCRGHHAGRMQGGGDHLAFLLFVALLKARQFRFRIGGGRGQALLQLLLALAQLGGIDGRRCRAAALEHGDLLVILRQLRIQR